MNRIGFTLLGLLSILLGGAIVLDPTVHNPILEYTIDFTGYNIPLGIFIILVGIGFIWTSLRRRNRK
jgi:hypothetical protein